MVEASISTSQMNMNLVDKNTSMTKEILEFDEKLLNKYF